MAEVFDELDQTTLVLGEPGSGKTTMTLELAPELLQQAITDSQPPSPTSCQPSQRPDLRAYLCPRACRACILERSRAWRAPPMTGPRRAAGALSRWTTCAVLFHLILAQSDSETRGESADDPVLYGCDNLTCKTPPKRKVGKPFPHCKWHGRMTRKITSASSEPRTPGGPDPDGTRRT
jgi:hypothetical protein